MTAYGFLVPGLSMAEHEIVVPVDHADPAGPVITVYAREVRATESLDDDQPWLLFLQGGPGLAAPRPLARDGWLGQAVRDYRVLLLDQRGTGRSTPVTERTLEQLPRAEDAAAYLAHFRADSIVRDAEALRERLGVERWSTLGQSYGGFCTFTYLSLAPAALQRCLVAGGVPPVGATPTEVYRRAWPRIAARNAEYRKRYPADAAVLGRIRDVLGGEPPLLPTGEPLTLARFRALGIAYGTSTGFAEVHHLLATAFDGDRLASAFLSEVAARTSMAVHPLYALLQEAIYCEGVASGFAAASTRAEVPELADDADPLLLTGETMPPTVYADERAMAPYAEVAALLHTKSDWGPLYDRDALAGTEVPVAAAVYTDDMYVDPDLSLSTVQGLSHARTWVTNEVDHDGLRRDERVYTRLHELATGRR